MNVGGQNVRALLDTGASISVMSSNFLNKTSYQSAKLIKPQHQKIKGVTGNYLEVLGMLDINLEIDGVSFQHQVHIIQDLHHSFILGLDFLTANHAHIDYDSNTLTINNEHVCQIITNSGLARTIKSIVIPKRSEITIPVLISRCNNGDQVLLEPLPSLMKNFHITAAKCLVKVQNRKAYLKVLNPTYSDVRLRNNKKLATVAEIVGSNDSATVFSLDSDSAITPSHRVASKDSDKSHRKSNLQFDLSESDLTNCQRARLLTFLKDHKDVFSTDLSDLGKTHLYKHKIETLPGSKPVRKQFYRTSPQMSKEIKKQVDEMLQNDIIEPSNSEWHSPVVMVKKKNGQLRFACDYRALNKITVPMSFPLPHLESVFDAIGDTKAKFFTNLDFRSAFWQVEMSPCSKHKAAFITQDGVYEWKRMPFGLMNSPISFQTLMSGVLREMNFKSVLVYIDDVLIFSKDFDSHLQDLTQVFTKLRDAGLTLQPSKCHFAVKQLKFLGHVISRHGVEVDSEKTKVVSQFPVPKKQKQVRSFLGMANYYRKFIHDYAKIAAPLNALLKKNSIFIWTKDCQQAFDTLKNALISAPILSYPNPEKSFVLTCDASDTAIGYYLSQVSIEGKEQVIAYGGKALSAQEKKYTTSEKELLAVVKGVQAYRPYLVGAKFTVDTDHRALVWLKSAKHTGRLERWALKLQEYDFDIIHRPGKNNYVADALSRLPYQDDSETKDPENKNPEISILQVKEDTKDSRSIQINLFYSPDDTEVIVLQEDQLQPVVEDTKHLSKLQRECGDFKDIINYLENQILPMDKAKHDAIVAESRHYSLANGILTHLFQRRCKRQQEEDRFITQIALPKVLRLDALRQYHDSLAGGGHLGIEKVRASIIQKYFWPRMHQDIVDYVKSCARCQKAKRNFNPTKPPMNPMPVKEKFECWQIDILGPLNKSTHGYEYILLCIDAGTRWPEAFPLRSQNAMEVATVLFDNIITRYGAPSILFSDRGRNFMSKVINALCEIFDISQYHTSAYHPNTNGLVERQNSVIAQSLRAYCDKDQKLWPKFLSGIMMSFRKSISANSTEFSPFFLMFGKEMRLPFDIELQPKDNMAGDAKLYIQEFMSNLKIYHKIAKENELYHQQKNKEKYDKTAKVPDFKLGDQVLMSIHQIPKGLTAKLYDKAQGPYRIVRLGPNYTYELKRLSDNKLHPSLVNAIHLKHYYDPEEHRAHLIPDNFPHARQPLDEVSDDKIDQQDPIQTQPLPDPNTPTDAQENTPNLALPQTADTPNIPDSQTSTNKTWNIKSLPSAKFKNGRRLIRVEWENGDRTWEPDESFSPELLAEINRKFTKNGKRRKTCMTKPSLLDSQL